MTQGTTVGLLALIAAIGATALAAEPARPPAARLALKLDRGITIDRQVHSIPPSPDRTFAADDIRLIKSMGFEFVKLVINPAVFQSNDGVDASRLWYFDRIVHYVTDEKLPVVVCIHPEWKQKEKMLADPEEFSRFVKFMDALSRHMASRWTADQLALQLMTEPPPAGKNPSDWNYWDTLQRRLWKTVRAEMPGHTLILSGDMGGSIEGLAHAVPVDDENVMYTFTFYEPNLFAWQGDPSAPLGPLMPSLGGLPYPSGPETLAALPTILNNIPEHWRAEVESRIRKYAAERWNRDKLAERIGKLDQWRRSHGGKLKLWCAEFGCQQGAPPADRCRYIGDLRRLFDQYDIGWAYWSYNEAYSAMTLDRTPSGPAKLQTPDRAILRELLPDKYR